MKARTYILMVLFILSQMACTLTEVQEPQEIELNEKTARLLDAENKFGFEIFQKIYATETEYENIMVSPLSISLALAMTYNGANGETKTAMEKTLKVYGLTVDDINQSYFDLVNALKSLDEKVLLEIANAIFYREDFLVENDFVTTNENYYDAEVSALDFNSPNALKTINGWVAEKTHDKIQTILNQITGDQVMFLLNAIYFKGIWGKEFNSESTKKLPFYLENGSTIQTETMQRLDTLPYISNNLFSAVQLNYGNGSYSMYVILPKPEENLKDLVSELNENNWKNWLNEFQKTQNVDIKLPKFKYAYEIKLNDILSDMGMGVSFTGAADFTGINRKGGLKIDYVKHKTFVEVNEEGTEAAAVTVVAINKMSTDPQKIPFYANRPFLYVITEKSTGAILFIGTVKNPQTH